MLKVKFIEFHQIVGNKRILRVNRVMSITSLVEPNF